MKTTMSTTLLFVVAAIWGSGFIASQLALDAGVSPELLMLVRFGVALLIVTTACYGRLRRTMRRSDIGGGVLIGVFLFLGFYVQVLGLQTTTPSNNAFLTATNVVMVPFIWWAVSHRRPENRIFLSSLLCLVGIGILSLRVANGFAFSAGDLLTLLCAFFFACHIATTGHYAARMDTIVLVFLQFVTASVLSLVVWVVADGSSIAAVQPSGIAAVVYLGIFSTCLCYFLQTHAQQYVSSAKVAIILACESLFGTLFSVLIGYDKLTVQMLVGGAVIVISLIITEWQPRPRASANGDS